MKERPILFSAPMVRAILDGTKTQTRLVLKPSPEQDQLLQIVVGSSGLHYVMDQTPIAFPETRRIRWDCPYGQPGDRLWVREKWQAWDCTSVMAKEWEPWDRERRRGLTINEYHAEYGTPDGIEYAATSESIGPWTPSIHMPRWASRITLEITGVRVERLQDISEADAIKEGVFRKVGTTPIGDAVETATGGELIYAKPTQAREEYSRLWESINGPGSWDASPWVWVVEFKRV